MGNVLAAGAPTPPLTTPPPVVPQPPPKQNEDAKENETLYPGPFEDLHKRCKDIFPSPFEGAKLTLNKGLSNHFQVSHTLTMSSVQPSGYKFGCTYVGTQQKSLTEVYPILVGEIDPSGNMNAQMIHQFADSIKCKFMGQIQNSKMVTSQFTADYKGKNFNGSCTLGNIDPLTESGIVVLQYLQGLTPRLSLGSEILYQYGSQVPGGEIAMYTFAGRYSSDKWQLSANLCPAAGGAHSCYSHKINENLSVGVELEASLRMGEATATVGYQYEIPSTGLTFRGQVDSNWCIGSVFEKRLQPLPFTLALSAYANHVKSSYRFGIGLLVG